MQKQRSYADINYYTFIFLHVYRLMTTADISIILN